MQPMSTEQFLLIFALCFVTMIICRTVPFFVLKGRELPQKVSRSLELIPPAAFAALVANDLLSPGMFDAGIWPAAAPLIAAAVVVAVARLSKSLLWCAVAGVVAYALLLMI